MKTTSKIVIAIFLAGVVIFGKIFMIEMLDFAKGEREYAILQLEHTKARFLKLAFAGRILDKQMFPNRDDEYRHSIVVRFAFLSSPQRTVGFSALQYSISSDSTLEMSVSKRIYELVKHSDLVSKDSNSSLLKVNGLDYQFLSADSLKWCPE